LRPDGTVFVVGASGHTAVYNVAAGTWSAGPDFPITSAGQLAVSDGPAALLPSGNVLVGASALNLFPTPKGSPPVLFFEFDGKQLNPVPAPPSASNDQTYYTNMLLLPTGQIFLTDGTVNIYTPSGSPDSSWAPTIAMAPSAVQAGMTYGITGTQFNGLSQAVGYGDDFQAATNYPLVRIVNNVTGHVFYCRTHNHSTMGVATGTAPVSTQFDVPASVESGPSTLVVVANGIASKPWNLTVASAVPTPRPSITEVDNGFSNIPNSSIQAGSWVVIKGLNLSSTNPGRGWNANESFPTSMDGTSVTINNKPAFLYYISPTQVNVQAPSDMAAGPVSVVVTNDGQISAAFTAQLQPFSPALLQWGGGQYPYAEITRNPDNAYIGNPSFVPGTVAAHAGDVLTLWVTGLGATDPAVPAGQQPAVVNGSFPVPITYPTVTVGGTNVTVLGAILRYAGLYQVNIHLPDSIGTGNLPIQVLAGGYQSPANILLLIVQ
jgi:uncharacterized protein (TIGR03437 family)